MEKSEVDYIYMQKKFYDSSESSPEKIVGSYLYHENFPYETQLLYLNGDIRKPLFPSFNERKAFDIACGEGRMIRRMNKIFGGGCDGADISNKMVSAARQRCQDSNIYITNGNDCGPAADNTYDFGFCTISMQHISSHTVRSSIIKDITRILKPDGKITLQLLLSKHFPYTLTDQLTGRSEMIRKYTLNKRHAGYFEDKFDAVGTNSKCDGVMGVRDIPEAIIDLKKFFNNVQVWFYDISLGRDFGTTYPRSLPPSHPNSHLTDGYHGTHFVFLHGSGPKK